MTLLSSIAGRVVRIAVAGVAAAALVGAGGWMLARARLGSNNEAALARVQRELSERFDSAGRALVLRAQHIAANRATIAAARRDNAAQRHLFQILDDELPADAAGTAGLSVFEGNGTPLAWSGGVSDLPRERIDGPPTMFAALDALGPRLVRIEPVPDPDRPNGPRLATIVAEQLVHTGADVSPVLADSYLLPTSVADVAVRAQSAPKTSQSPYTFTIAAEDGKPLVEAEVSPESLAAARMRWRVWIRTAVLAVLALTILMCAAPVLEWRRRSRTAGSMAASTTTLLLMLLAARVVVVLAAGPFLATSFAPPLTIVPDALVLIAVVWIALDVIERRRTARPRRLLTRIDASTYLAIGAAYLAAGATATAILWGYEHVLAGIAAQSSVNLLHFALHPLEAGRLGMAAGVVLFHAGVIWAAITVLRLPAILWRVPRSSGLRALSAFAGGAGVLLVLLLAHRLAPQLSPTPLRPLQFAIATAVVGAIILSRPRGPFRRASQAARLGLFLVALLVPALAMYPSLDAFATSSKEHLVAETFAPQAASQREELQLRRLPHALEAIDAMPSLDEFVTSFAKEAAPTTDRAFIVWSQTELAKFRTASSVELYGPNGRLVSRFSLNLPDYGTTTYEARGCEWELYEEVSPFGSSLRNALRASRGICDGDRRVGAIVVRATLDYESLPFISSENPYVASFGPDVHATPETSIGHDVEFAVYGWSRAPLYSSGPKVWPLPDEVFNRMVASREPFWANVSRDGQPFRVYFFSDRGGIYALGFPATDALGHLINLGELVFLSAVLYVTLLAGATLFNMITSRTPASGRALLRELRSSFYRKLFIAFVASAVVPVVVLAFATQRYFANQFRAGVEESAVKTATVAQRLVEDYAVLQRRGGTSLALVDDQFMELVHRAINQDVNLFDRERLQATSQRPLFANHLLPSRTPGKVYSSIVLDRLPTSVQIEEVGGLQYLLAAAPVRAGGSEGIVTVPQTLRQPEIEQQIDELDRRIVSASVLFVLLGAALGYTMAERIADPVSRLTRATRRIARGDLDARVAATSSDELRRLVEDFNQMADDLKRQRTDLERTQRLEAWADMARQVAHDIKNPLTPIQLSAEHARRVNIDRGRPLSPALDECVNSILSQVRLLRQIAAEFSSFASSPTPRPEPTNIPALIEETVDPYRVGLGHRIAIVVNAEPGLPLVSVDRTLMARALTNIIENALHAMPGNGTLTFETRRSPAESTVIVEVSDTGVGMDEDALKRIFEPYFSTKASGTGLGLTIAKRNVELTGGTIAVSSQRGVGTTVTIRLPYVE